MHRDRRLVYIVLESCYTKCLTTFKTFFGYHKYMYISVTGMMMELGSPVSVRLLLFISIIQVFRID